MDTGLLTTLIAAGAGLGGAFIGGAVTAISSAYNLRAGFEQQRQLEDRRFQQRLDFEASERSVRAFALRRTVHRLLRRLHNTANMDPRTRVYLNSWGKAADALRLALEDRETDLLLSSDEYKTLWSAADEGQVSAIIMRAGGEGAVNGLRFDPAAANATLSLFFEALRDAFTALGDPANANRATAALERGFIGCGIFLSDDTLFYPIPAAGAPSIVDSAKAR